MNHNSIQSLQKELTLEKELALKAGEIMLQYFDTNQHEVTKGDGTPVTIADTMINAMVIKEIKRQFPQDIIIGEEESTGVYGEGRRWICDPIDGTAAFMMGLPSAMFSICCVIDGVPMAAVVYEPLRKQLYTAVRGKGSYCNDKKLQVSTHGFDKALIALAPDYIRTQFVNEPFMQRLLAHNKELAIFPGAVFRSCMVAQGRIAGFPHPKVKPYDIAAVHLIVEEAGGKVTDVHGEALDYTKDFRGAIISNGIIHNNLIALLT